MINQEPDYKTPPVVYACKACGHNEIITDGLRNVARCPAYGSSEFVRVKELTE